MVATATSVAGRSFVPKDVNPGDFSQLEPLYRALLDRPASTVADLERWLLDSSELAAVEEEYGARRYIDKSCHTDDPEIEKRFLDFVENVEPKIKPLSFRLQKKLLDSPAIAQLNAARYGVMLRRWKADVDLFREQNVPLETELTKLN